MVVGAGLTMLLGLLHAADDFARAEVARPRTFALLVIAASVLYLFGLAYCWSGRRLGYLIILLLSALYFYSVFLSHAFGLAKAQSLLGIARSTGAFFVFVSLSAGISSLVTGVLAAYGLVKSGTSWKNMPA